jgi:rhodanese-related sulfurtransferase
VVEESADRRSPVKKGGTLSAILRGLLGPGVAHVTAKEAHSRLPAAVVLDVRELHEYRDGHIPGSLHIPLREVGRRLREIDREREVIVVCRSGSRSGAAAKLLGDHGYQVQNLRGGMIAWSRAGLPVRSGKARR